MPEITGVPVFVLNIWISIGKELVMSQIVACRTDSGIVFAADSKALELDPNNEIVELKTNRLLQLTPHTVIVTGGAGARFGPLQSVSRGI